MMTYDDYLKLVITARLKMGRGVITRVAEALHMTVHVLKKEMDRLSIPLPKKRGRKAKETHS